MPLRRTSSCLLLAGLLVSGAGVAQAELAYLNQPTNLHAGPATNYPIITVVGTDAMVDVYGCEAGYQWCDVGLTDGTRGWMWANSLYFAQNNAYVPLMTSAPSFGVPLITFTLGAYWPLYYRNRPWYSNNIWWHGMRPPSGAGWRPPAPPRPFPPRPPNRPGGRPPMNVRPPSGNGHGRPPHGNNNGRPPAGNGNARPPAGNNNQRPPAGNNNQRPPANNNMRPPSGNNARPPAGNNARPPAGGGGSRPSPGPGSSGGGRPSGGGQSRPGGGGPGR